MLVSLAHAFYECFFFAGTRYSVDPYLLASIAKVESAFNPKAINKNQNGSFDYGIMQINSYWILHYKIPLEWIQEPCYNIHFGAMILRNCMDMYKNNLQLAIDCYNRGTKADGDSTYVLKVYNSYKKIMKLVR